MDIKDRQTIGENDRTTKERSNLRHHKDPGGGKMHFSTRVQPRLEDILQDSQQRLGVPHLGLVRASILGGAKIQKIAHNTADMRAWRHALCNTRMRPCSCSCTTESLRTRTVYQRASGQILIIRELFQYQKICMQFGEDSVPDSHPMLKASRAIRDPEN